MDDQTEVIRHNIEETRSSLSEKLETLEQSVVGTVQNTTCAVSETVETVKEAVQETVGAVKDTIASTVETVKGTVRSSVEAVKSSLDVSQHVRNHPWAMLGGSVAAGYLAGALLAPCRTRNGHAGALDGPDYHLEGNGRSRAHETQQETAKQLGASESAARPSGRRLWSALSGEVDKLRKIAIGTVAGVVREMIEQNVAGDLAQQLIQVVDDVNQKLDGETIRPPFFKAQSEEHDGSACDGEMAAGTA